MEENGDELEKMEVPNIILGDTSSSYWKEKHKDNIMKHHLVGNIRKQDFLNFRMIFKNVLYGLYSDVFLHAVCSISWLF